MSKTKIIGVVISDYKGIDKLTLPISKSKTCLVGDNGSGKTSILEALSARYAINSSSNDFHHNNIWTLVVDVSDIEELIEFGISTVEVKLKGNNENFRLNAISIEGIDNYIKKVESSIINGEQQYKDSINYMIQLLNELYDWIEALINEFGEEKLRESDFSLRTLKDIKDEMNKLENHLNKNSSTISVLFPYLATRFDESEFYSNDKFRMIANPINEQDFKEFMSFYKNYTIEDDGFMFDWAKVNEKYSQINKMFTIINPQIESHNETKNNTKEQIHQNSDAIYIIKENVTDLLDKIVTKAISYLNGVSMITSSDFDSQNTKKRQFNKDGKMVLNEMKILDDYTDKSGLSDGEKWIYEFAKTVEQSESKCLFIDEPCMYLNSKYFDRMAIVLDELVKRDYQVIYSTHNSSLVTLNKEDLVYQVKFDKKVNIERFNFKKIEFDKILIGDLIIMSTRKLLLVEGENDYLLFKYVLKKLNIDSSLYNLFECRGHGIVQMTEFCIENNIDFLTVSDLDKTEDFERFLGSNFDKFKSNIEFVGTAEIPEIEGYMEQSDLDNFTIWDENKGKYKMRSKIVKKCVKQNIDLSEKFLKRIKKTLGNL